MFDRYVAKLDPKLTYSLIGREVCQDAFAGFFLVLVITGCGRYPEANHTSRVNKIAGNQSQPESLKAILAGLQVFLMRFDRQHHLRPPNTLRHYLRKTPIHLRQFLSICLEFHRIGKLHEFHLHY